MKKLVLVGLLLATPVLAQQPDPAYQLDSAVVSVTTIVSNMRQQIISDHQQITALQQQIQAVTAERDNLKAETAKPTQPGPADLTLPGIKQK